MSWESFRLHHTFQLILYILNVLLAGKTSVVIIFRMIGRRCSSTISIVSNCLLSLITFGSDVRKSAPVAMVKTYAGFTCKKYIHYVEDQLKGMMKSKTFPIMRYAEVLLNYVEALNELGSNTYTDEENGITVSRDVDEMVKYFNMVRYRAGLPGITADDARDVTTMRDLIKRDNVCLHRKTPHVFHA